jgi:[acyl-carrier-protein] S-malonyltransferase
MCRGLWQIPAARDVLRRLEPVLGDDLEELTTRAAGEGLALNSNSQRAIHAHHLGHWFSYRALHPGARLDGAIGHSVGIAAALVAAGALSVEDSAIFVAERSRAFSEVCAGLSDPQGLAAVATENLDDLIEELPRFPGLALALRNSRGKGTVGGPIVQIERLAREARERGWPLRVVLLEVEGPYHTPVFASVGPRLARVLSRIVIDPPGVPVFMGTSGRGETDPERIRELLARQPSSPERHWDAVRAAYAHGCREFLEIASSPQPITWIPDQLVDEQGEPLPGVTTRAVTTEELI